MTDPSVPTKIYCFRIGEAYDDLTPVFAIDARDYPDGDAAMADVRDASEALRQLHLIADYETSTADPQTLRPDLPSWPQWRERHIVHGEPTGVRPSNTAWTAPDGWTEMGEWLERSHEWLRDQLTSAGGSILGGETVVVSDPGPVRVGGASVIPAEEKYRADSSLLVDPPTGQPALDALDTISQSLRRAGWEVNEPVREPEATTVHATNVGFQIDAVWQHSEASIYLFGESPVVDATIFAGPTAAP